MMVRLRANLIATVALLLLALLPGQVFAGEIEKVKIGPSGPDKKVPIGEQFYLTGATPSGAESVFPVFVRYRYGAWGLTTRNPARGPRNCSEVIAALPPEDADLGALASAGLKRVDELWPNSPAVSATFTGAKKTSPNTVYDYLTAGRHGENVYAPPGWIRSQHTAAEQKEWSVLVGADRSFFRPGARYCLMLVVSKTEDFEIDNFDTKLTAYAAAHGLCQAQPTQAARLQCEEKEFTNLFTSLSATMTSGATKTLTFDGKPIAKIGQAVTDDFVSYYTSIPVLSPGLQSLLPEWEKAFQPLPVVGAGRLPTVGTTNFGGGVSLKAAVGGPNAELLQLILNLLALDQKVDKSGASFLLPARNPAGGVATPAFTINEIEIIFDSAGVSEKMTFRGVPVGGGAAQTVTLPIKLSELTYPVGQPGVSVTLEDIVQFAGGRIHDGSAYQNLSAIPSSKLEVDLACPKLGPGCLQSATDNLPKLEALLASFDELDVVLERAGDARGGALSSRLDQLLVQWLSSVGLRSCSDLASATVMSTVAANCNPAGLDPWPDFIDGDSDPFGQVHQVLFDLVPQTKKWLAEHAKILDKLEVTVATRVGGGLDVGIALDKKGFFDAYLTESAGIAFLPGEGGNLNTTYIGVQAFFYPNPINEPMWTNGAQVDARRLFGLELGLRPTAKNFGPGQRYGPWPNSQMPALFAGGVLQLIPYVTVGGGMAVFGYDTSVLSGEQTVLRAAPYVSISAEVNLVNLVRRLAGLEPLATTSQVVK